MCNLACVSAPVGVHAGTDDYEYDESKSVKGSQFVGLPLDEDNEDDKTEPRVDAWLAQLKGEMAM